MNYVGFDWASRAHDVTVLDEAGGVLDRWAFPHSETGWVTTLDRLARHGSAAEVPVIIERTCGLIVDRLLAAGHPVVPVHPTAFYAARPRWGASGAKSDPGDSYKLADYLRTDGHRLRRLTPTDPGLHELQALVRLRDDQVRARTAATNQLTAILDNYWPGPKQLFMSLASQIALAFLTDYPTPTSAAHLGEARMAAFCRRHAYRGGKSPAELLSRLRAAPVAPVGLPPATLAAMVTAQVTVLKTLQTVISDVERLIAVRVVAHPRSNLFESARGRHDQPGTVARRGRSDPRPGGQCRTSRDRMRRGACHPFLRPDPRRLLPLGREYPRPQGHHQLRSQRSNARRLGRRTLRRRPGTRKTQPARHPHRRPRPAPRDLGLLDQRPALQPRPASQQSVPSPLPPRRSAGAVKIGAPHRRNDLDRAEHRHIIRSGGTVTLADIDLT